MNAALENHFSPDYATARERFRAAARDAGAALDALELEACGARDELLATDIAWLGAPDAARIVLHSSGVHGVEAYAGAAIQLAALDGLPRPPAGCALVLAHVLNPWGMSWLRRVNENNVDLNRNFLRPGETWSGAPRLYGALDRALNPPSPPGFDWFPVTMAALALRHGMRSLTQAIAQGQYEFPQGLFYGGSELQPGPRRYADWLQRRCGHAQYVFALDVHTGLGRAGEQMLVLEPGVGATPPAVLARALGSPLVAPGRTAAAYVVRGSMGGVPGRALPGARVDFLLQELGTYPAFTVLRALREENRWHHHGGATLDHPAKRALREAMCPAAPAWRRRVVGHGINLLRSACAWSFHDLRTV